jgi:hypothetical protein
VELEKDQEHLPPPERADGAASARQKPRRLSRRDRHLLALLGLCRYLTVRQVVTLGIHATTPKPVEYGLRGLAGEQTEYKVRPYRPALVRRLRLQAFDGAPLELWGLRAAGYSVAGAELGEALRVLPTDVGAAFAAHFVFLTDLFVALVGPYARAGVAPRALPFRWEVGEDAELPWLGRDDSGDARQRLIRPDAVLEVPGAQRRVFVECETGSHTLVPRNSRRHQSTVRKLEQYDDFVSGFVDLASGLTHARRKYPDGWPAEVLFLVPTESRQAATTRVLAEARAARGPRCIAAQALTLAGADAYLQRLLPAAPARVPDAVERTRPLSRARPPRPASFYGEPEHRAVKDFVLESQAALAEANRRLRGRRLPPVPEPASAGRMADFLRRAQAELARGRGETGRTP